MRGGLNSTVLPCLPGQDAPPPMAAIPGPVPLEAVVEFEAVFRTACAISSALTTPLAHARCDHTRYLFPTAADDSFVERQVCRFMADLTLPDRPPVATELFKRHLPPHLHAPPLRPLSFVYPTVFHPGVLPLQLDGSS